MHSHTCFCVQRFTSALKQETFHNGDFVVRQGDIGDRFFIIESGEVSIEELKAGQDERTVLTTLYAGGHFGEYSLLREGPRMASVIARSPVVAHSLDRVSFQTLCAEDPAFEAFIKELVAETDATRKKREELLAKQRNATTLRFVRGNKSDTRVTHTVERSRTIAKEEMINHYVIGRQLGSGSYGTHYSYASIAFFHISSMIIGFCVQVRCLSARTRWMTLNGR
jgi:CRP-like cAMP-binding protein